jgi:hypothetical protein
VVEADTAAPCCSDCGNILHRTVAFVLSQFQSNKDPWTYTSKPAHEKSGHCCILRRVSEDRLLADAIVVYEAWT